MTETPPPTAGGILRETDEREGWHHGWILQSCVRSTAAASYLPQAQTNSRPIPAVLPHTITFSHSSRVPRFTLWSLRKHVMRSRGRADTCLGSRLIRSQVDSSKKRSPKMHWGWFEIRSVRPYWDVATFFQHVFCVLCNVSQLHALVHCNADDMFRLSYLLRKQQIIVNTLCFKLNNCNIPTDLP